MVRRRTALLPLPQELAIGSDQGCRRGIEPQRHVGVVLVLQPVAGPVIRVEVIVVMAMPVPCLVRETCRRQAVHDLSGSQVMHC